MTDTGPQDPDPFFDTWFIIDAQTGKSEDWVGNPFTAMREWEEQANATHPDAHGIAVTHDQHWVRLDHEVPIFGEAWTLEHQYREEGKYYDLTDAESTQEWAEQQEALADTFNRGYRFGRAWSVWCPEGELGSTHCTLMIPISTQLFDFARRHDWDADAITQAARARTNLWDELLRRAARHDKET